MYIKKEKDVKFNWKFESIAKVSAKGKQQTTETLLLADRIETVWASREVVAVTRRVGWEKEIHLMKMEKRDSKQMSQFMYLFFMFLHSFQHSRYGVKAPGEKKGSKLESTSHSSKETPRRC